MRKIGINFTARGDMSEEDFFRKISELGFQVCMSEMHELEEHIRLTKWMEKYNLEYDEIHAPFSHTNDLWLEGDGGEQMYKETIECIERCQMLNAPMTVIHLAKGATPPSITDIGRSRFENIVEFAMKKNVKVAFENIATLSQLAWAMETFKDESMVGFCWDCGHEGCFTQEIEFMPLFGKRLMCTHIHDNEGEVNKDSHMIPFDGKFNYERFTKQIRESGYTGPLTLEILPKKTKYYQDVSPDAYLEKAAAAVKRLVYMVEGNV